MSRFFGVIDESLGPLSWRDRDSANHRRRLSCGADPVASLDALRRGLVIAQDSGNRFTESLLAGSLCRLEAV